MATRYVPAILAVLVLFGCSGAPTEPEPAPRRAREAAPLVDQPVRNAPAVTIVAFPRTVEVGEGAVVVHAPQISSWRDFEVIEGIAALETLPPDERPKRFAVMSFRAATETDLDTRMIELTDVEILSIKENGEEIPLAQRRVFARALPEARTIPLDLAISYLAENALPASDEGLSVEPPEIIVSTTSAVLVLFHGEPVLAPIEGSELRFAANTNWSVFEEPASGRWYLCNDDTWLQADALEGPWNWSGALPEAIRNLPATDDWRSTREAAAAWSGAPSFPAPTVHVSTEPAELLLLVGEPVLEPVADTGLESVTNTESPLFRHGGTWYYLASGRWFGAEELGGAWSFVPALPDAFAAIPGDHPGAYVRAAVPGTPEATMAAIEAQVPRKTEVPNGTVLPIEVTYYGDPEFERIAGTSLERAANSPQQIIHAAGAYYLCYSGMWFRAEAPEGPWALARSVPDEVYAIPPESPAFAVTDVKVYESTASTTTYGHSARYDANIYVQYGVPVYGTGYYYAPYHYPYYGYPVYHHYPYSYGTGSVYNTSTGAYGTVSRAYGPYGGYGYASGYNPETGRYARAEAVYDYDEWYAVGEAYNPDSGRYLGTERYYDAASDTWRTETRVEGAEGGGNLSRYGGDDFGQASIRTDAGGSGTFQRRASEGGWDTAGSFTTAEGETISSSGRYVDGSGSTTLSGTGGGSGTVSRTVDDSGVSREGSFTRDGNTVSTTTNRDGLQSTTTFESTDGGRGAVSGSPGSVTGAGQSASGDVYATRDGNVYRRTDEGWQQYDGNESWSSLGNGSLGATERSGRFEGAGTGSFGQNAQDRGWGGFEGSALSALERDFRARDRGMNRGTLSRGGRSFGGRGRRR